MNISSPVVYSVKEYYDKTGHSGSDINWAMPSFSIEDIQEFLINRGYFILFHEYKINRVDYNNGSVGREYVEVRTDLFAVRPEQVASLPNVFSPEEAKRYDAIATFRSILKKKLMEL